MEVERRWFIVGLGSCLLPIPAGFPVTPQLFQWKVTISAEHWHFDQRTRKEAILYVDEPIRSGDKWSKAFMRIAEKMDRDLPKGGGHSYGYHVEAADRSGWGDIMGFPDQDT